LIPIEDNRTIVFRFFDWGAIQDLDADEMLMRIGAIGNSIEFLKSLHSELIETYQQKYDLTHDRHGKEAQTSLVLVYPGLLVLWRLLSRLRR
jgi:hypothetical protein